MPGPFTVELTDDDYWTIRSALTVAQRKAQKAYDQTETSYRATGSTASRNANVRHARTLGEIAAVIEKLGEARQPGVQQLVDDLTPSKETTTA